VLTTGAGGPAAGRLVRGARVPLLRVASAAGVLVAGVRAAGVLVAGVP
jgi:hypothetical protein